ncbi:MAG: flagellar motor switch protein FliN [Planctomycetota bacterium]
MADEQDKLPDDAPEEPTNGPEDSPESGSPADPESVLDAAEAAADQLASDTEAEAASAEASVNGDQAAAAEAMDPKMAELLAATKAAISNATGSGATADDPMAAAASAMPPAGQSAPQPDIDALQYELPDLAGAGAPEGMSQAEYDLLGEVNLNVKIELGRTRMLLEDVLKLSDGAVVELDKLAGDPVDVYVNDQRVATGEVLVLNDNFCVRISEIIDPHGDDDENA